MNSNMNRLEATLLKLLNMLKTDEKTLGGTKKPAFLFPNLRPKAKRR